MARQVLRVRLRVRLVAAVTLEQRVGGGRINVRWLGVGVMFASLYGLGSASLFAGCACKFILRFFATENLQTVRVVVVDRSREPRSVQRVRASLRGSYARSLGGSPVALLPHVFFHP